MPVTIYCSGSVASMSGAVWGCCNLRNRQKWYVNSLLSHSRLALVEQDEVCILKRLLPLLLILLTQLERSL